MDKKLLKKLPKACGVYILKDARGRTVYVGKSNCIQKRIYSHTRTKLGGRFSRVDFILTDSELEALILEARLIKQLMPRYNVSLRDDKAYPYIKMTKNEEYPRLLIARKAEKDGASYFGPFRAATAKSVLKILNGLYGLRRCSGGEFRKRAQPCLNFHMRKCLGPCAGRVAKKDYDDAIRQIGIFFTKGPKQALKVMKKEMEKASSRFEYEKAARIRDRMNWLGNAINKKEMVTERHKASITSLGEIATLIGAGATPERIEAFDISNTGPENTVGAMVVFRKGAPFKQDYRKFNISAGSLPNDAAAIYETVLRRYSKSQASLLPLPDLILIDGGRQQLGAAEKALKECGKDIPVIAIAKRNEEIFSPGLKDPLPIAAGSKGLLFIRRIRDEAHRFAISSHRARRRKKAREAS